MFIKSDQATGPCDLCQEYPATIGGLSKGATGRVCEVLWFCTKCAHGEVKSAQYARNNIEKYFGEGAYPDF